MASNKMRVNKKYMKEVGTKHGYTYRWRAIRSLQLWELTIQHFEVVKPDGEVYMPKSANIESMNKIFQTAPELLNSMFVKIYMYNYDLKHKSFKNMREFAYTAICRTIYNIYFMHLYGPADVILYTKDDEKYRVRMFNEDRKR